MKQYERISTIAEAVRLTAENAEDVARWCHADNWGLNKEGTPEISLMTIHDWMFALAGDWIVKEGDIFVVMTNEFFTKFYKEVE